MRGYDNAVKDNRPFGRDISNFSRKDIGSVPSFYNFQTAQLTKVDRSASNEATLSRLKEFGNLIEETQENINESSINACPEYAADISSYLQERQKVHLISQLELKDKQRESVIEWLVGAQLHFNLKDETLYMAVELFDRFINKQKTSYDKLTLIGIVVILIAAKYEEIYPPHLRDFTSYCGEDFRRSEIHAMELTVLKTLNFDLSVPTVLAFLQRLKKLTSANETKFNLAMFICEVQMLSGKMCKYSPSLLALSGFYLAEKAIANEYSLDNLPLKETKHTKEEINDCAKEMLSNVLIKEKIVLSNISRKYRKCKDVLKIPLNSNLLN